MARGRILIIDDEESVRVTLGAILSEVGHTVTLAAGLGDALVHLIDTEFDVVLTDLRLDDGDGLAVLEQTRRHWPDTVTLILTGYASIDSAIGAMRHGAYDYLCKPCSPEELIATVARGLERRQLTLQVRQQLHDLQTAITVARELHSALATRAEGTAALLRERERVLGTICADLQHSLVMISGLVQEQLGRLRAESASAKDPCAVVACLEQVHAETHALAQRVNAAVRLTRAESVQDLPSAAPVAAFEIALGGLPVHTSA